MKQTGGKSNKVVDDLSKVNLIKQELKIGILGFEDMIDMYEEDTYFKEIYASVKNLVIHNRSQWVNYLIQGVVYELIHLSKQERRSEKAEEFAE